MQQKIKFPISYISFNHKIKHIQEIYESQKNLKSVCQSICQFFQLFWPNYSSISSSLHTAQSFCTTQKWPYMEVY